MTTPTALERLINIIEDQFQSARHEVFFQSSALLEEKIIMGESEADRIFADMMAEVRNAYPTAYALWEETRRMIAAEQEAERKAKQAAADAADPIPF